MTMVNGCVIDDEALVWLRTIFSVLARVLELHCIGKAICYV